MLPAERRKIILEYVESRRSASVTELCNMLSVSEMTVRRDLRILSNEGLLQRVYGGAILRHGRSYEPPYPTRQTVNPHLKEAIGRRAAQLVRPGSSLAIDVGTTTVELARNLVGTTDLTIVTSSMRVANVLSEAPGITLILSGGIMRPQEMSMVGHVATRTYRDFRVDLAFIGVGGLDPVAGLTEFNLEDSLVKQAIIDNAGQVIVLADSSKFGATCFVSVAPIGVVDTIVTDWEAPRDLVAQLEEQGIEVITARQGD